MTALIVLAAGQGTRMRSDRPKVLHEVAGAPLLHHAMRGGIDLRPERVVVVTGHGGEAVAEAARALMPVVRPSALRSSARLRTALRTAVLRPPFLRTPALRSPADRMSSLPTLVETQTDRTAALRTPAARALRPAAVRLPALRPRALRSSAQRPRAAKLPAASYGFRG